jgi:hypothetical protein
MTETFFFPPSQPTEDLDVPQISRPLMQLRTADIALLFQKSQANRYALEIVLGELARRTTPQASRLAERVSETYRRLLQKQASVVRPSPTACFGQTDPWADSPDIGFLKKMGYAVGRSGATVLKRRRILDEVYLRRVPTSFAESYRSEWGMPETGKRLQKMAEAIATFARNARQKNQRVHMDEAITDYESDLAYLKATYYDGHWAFAWPTTLVS